MSSLYQTKRELPFHISVGAVVVRDGKVLVHRRAKAQAPEQFRDNFGDREEVYILMRETVEDNESLADAVLRGVREEFGFMGTVEKFLGAKSHVILAGTPAWEWEKTTLYFLVTPSEAVERVIDDESFSDLEWHEPGFLIERMRGQGGETRQDLDESVIIERYVQYR